MDIGAKRCRSRTVLSHTQRSEVLSITMMSMEGARPSSADFKLVPLYSALFGSRVKYLQPRLKHGTLCLSLDEPVGTHALSLESRENRLNRSASSHSEVERSRASANLDFAFSRLSQKLGDVTLRCSIFTLLLVNKTSIFLHLA